MFFCIQGEAWRRTGVLFKWDNGFEGDIHMKTDGCWDPLATLILAEENSLESLLYFNKQYAEEAFWLNLFYSTNLYNQAWELKTWLQANTLITDVTFESSWINSILVGCIWKKIFSFPLTMVVCSYAVRNKTKITENPEDLFSGHYYSSPFGSVWMVGTEPD